MHDFRSPRDLISRRREQRWILPALVLVLVGAVLFTNRGNSDSGAKLGLVDQVQPAGDAADLETGPAVGKLAPNFRLERPDGETVLLSDLRGRPVLLTFWAADSCPDCAADLLTLQQVATRYRDTVTVLGIDVDEPAQRVTTVVDGLGITFPQLLDSGKDVARAYGVDTMPTTVVIDARGVIISIDAQSLAAAEIETRLPPLPNATPG